MRKQSVGFTLFEVMVAVAIIGIVLTSLASLEIALMRGTINTSLRFDRLWHMVFFLKQAHVKDADKDTKKIKNPEMNMIFERTDVPKESPLSSLEGLKIERVEAHYKTISGMKSDSIITLRYQPKDEHEARNEPA